MAGEGCRGGRGVGAVGRSGRGGRSRGGGLVRRSGVAGSDVVVTGGRHDRGMERSGVLGRGSRVDRLRAYEPERIVGRWWCPVCGRAAHRTARPGRPRVYCSNACRQKAYRARRHERRVRPFVPPCTPRRARTRDRSHAVRPAPDLVAGRYDVAGRELTLCGAFARRDHVPPYVHTDFVTGLEWSCRRCTDLGPD